MRKLFLAAVALFVISVVAAPSAGAQEVEKEAKAEMTEKMAKEAKAKWMKGTMTPPGQEAMDVGYKFTKDDDGLKGWLVGEAEGEKYEIPLEDLSWGEDYVSYSWSPPDQASLVISCNLKMQDDGGYAGDCTDNGEQGETGQMTMAAMEKQDMEKMEMKKKEMKKDDPQEY